MNFLKKTILIVFVLFAAQLVYSQQTVSASGGEATGAGGSSSYTVGQVFYTTTAATTGSVSQGVQQAFEFQTLSNPRLTTVNLAAVTYPNPTTDFVVLKITDSTLKNLRYILFDINGKSIASGAIAASNIKIPMKHLSIGMYLLKVTRKNQLLKTFKIIKKQ